MDSNIITSILEIDQKAKDKITQAEQMKNKIIADAKAEEERIINSKVHDADEKLRLIEEEEKKKSQAHLIEIEKKKSEEIEKLNSVYEERHEDWEENIFKAIINS